MAVRVVLDSPPVAKPASAAALNTSAGRTLSPSALFAAQARGDSAVPSLPAASTPMAPTAATQILSGGSGGGGSSVAPTPALTPADLDNYITNNYLYTSTANAGDRALQNYDASTLQGQQATEAQQAQKQGTLTQNLDNLGQQNAEDLAGRGLLNSGINFQNQDKINQQGAQGQNQIAQLLTDFINQRQTGREGQVAVNQAALNQQIAALTGQFNTQNNTTLNPGL